LFIGLHIPRPGRRFRRVASAPFGARGGDSRSPSAVFSPRRARYRYRSRGGDDRIRAIDIVPSSSFVSQILVVSAPYATRAM
jgi:hypothetical protein